MHLYKIMDLSYSPSPLGLTVCQRSAINTVLSTESNIGVVGSQSETQGLVKGGWKLTDEQYTQVVEDNGQYSFVGEDTALFAHLVVQWYKERGATSSLSEMILCPAYQRIIGMGEAAVPLILTQMREEKDNPDHWSAALEAITGANPVPEEICGDTVRIAEAWFVWAEENNVWSFAG